MEKPAITYHKSHMSFTGRLPACSVYDPRRWLATSPAGYGAGPQAGTGAHCAKARRGAAGADGATAAAGMGESDMAAGQGPGGACKVDASARRQAASWRNGVTVPAGRTPAGRTPAPARTVESVRGLDVLEGANDGARDRQTRQTRLTRGSEDRLPERGARKRGQSAVRIVQFHVFRKGQGAYFGPGGAGIRGAPLILRLSRCESLDNAQDLQTATLGDVSYVQSNLFRFVMT
jgi:hypothetical protein